MLYLDFSRFAKSYIIDFYKTLAQLPKLRVASSSLVCRSIKKKTLKHPEFQRLFSSPPSKGASEAPAPSPGLPRSRPVSYPDGGSVPRQSSGGQLRESPAPIIHKSL